MSNNEEARVRLPQVRADNKEKLPDSVTDPSKSSRGRKLMAWLLQELHRRGCVPVKGDKRNAMRREVAERLRFESGVVSAGRPPPAGRGVRPWLRAAADRIVREGDATAFVETLDRHGNGRFDPSRAERRSDDLSDDLRCK